MKDIQSGLTGRQLMEKYGFSVHELGLLTRWALSTGIVDEAHIADDREDPRTPARFEDSRRFNRSKLDFTLVARTVLRPDKTGRITDMCERGFQVVGLPAKAGKSAELEIVTDWRSNEPPVFVEATCRWSNAGGGFPGVTAGFEVTEVRRGDFSRLLEDVSPLSLSEISPSDLWGPAGTSEDRMDSDRLGGRRSKFDLEGLEEKISRARFVKILDILSVPCLLIDRRGRMIHVNSYSAKISPDIFRVIGRPFSSIFPDRATPAKVEAAASTQSVVEATLRIEGELVPCRVESRVLGDPDGAHLLVFLKPSPTDPVGSVAQLGEITNFCRMKPAEDSPVTLPTGTERLMKIDTDCPDESGPLNAYTPAEGAVAVEDRTGKPEFFDPSEVHSSVGSDQCPRSTVMREVLEQCRVVAKTDTLVLLHGESGSGKDYLAQFIHRHSSRSGGPFRSVNCAAIPQHLAETEFFGHEEGAFTGAHIPKDGVLESAPGGTLLLNEIGELPLALQAKLLTFLDTGRFFRVGGQSEVSMDSRILAATNRDLKDSVRRGSFRADLFYRLNVVPIRVPPLRERIEDLPFLIEDLTVDLVRRLRLNTVPTADPKTMSSLRAYHWPGNVRELKNRLERSLGLSKGKKISLALMFNHNGHEQWEFNFRFPVGGDFNDFKVEVLRRLVAEALVRADGKRQAAAKLLGITRYALKRHMTNLGLMGTDHE